MSIERFCLKLSNFQLNASKSFSLLRDENQFSDVTLISDDHKMVTAHRIVLSSCSEYFKEILTQNKLQNPMICLEGVSHIDLNKVLDYIYHGEIQVYQDYLERFLNLARRFKLDGLTVGSDFASKPELRSEEPGITASQFDLPPEPLLMKDEQLEASFLPELIDGKVVENKSQKNQTNLVEKCDKKEELIADPKDVEWYFLKTRKSSLGPGVLITHSDKYKFHENGVDRYTLYDGKRSFWWSCSEKKRTGCRATAVMRKTTIPGKHGEEKRIDHKLVRVSPEEAHALYHGPIHHKIQAEKIMTKLKLIATDDMFEKISKIEKRVLEEELWSKYSEDEAKLIRANMPDKIYNTLSNIRANLREKHLKSFEGSCEEES